MSEVDARPIPREQALRLCCRRFSKGDPARMCVSNRPGNRGCNLVTDQWTKEEGRVG